MASLLNDKKSEFHRTRCTWIISDGLEKSEDSFNSDHCNYQSKQIGIISKQAFYDLQEGQANAKTDSEDILNSKCDVFLCIDNAGTRLTEKQAVLKFRSSLATYLAEKQGEY